MKSISHWLGQLENEEEEEEYTIFFAAAAAFAFYFAFLLFLLVISLRNYHAHSWNSSIFNIRRRKAS